MKTSIVQIIVAVIVLPLLTLIITVCGFIPWKNAVDISGIVVDAKTGQPVTNARVIVRLVGWYFFDESHLGYGLVTNGNGQFALKVRAPMRYTWIYVHASTPNDDYGRVEARTSHVIVRTQPIPLNRRGEEYMHYRDFRASGALDKHLWYETVIFLDQKW